METKDLSSRPRCAVIQWAILGKTLLLHGPQFLRLENDRVGEEDLQGSFYKRDSEMEVNLHPLIQQQNSKRILNKALTRWLADTTLTLSAEASMPGRPIIRHLPCFLRETNKIWDGLPRTPKGSP